MPQQQAVTIIKSKHSKISCKKFWMKRRKKDILIVQGDWNSSIGKESSNDWDGTSGEHCNTETNGRGLRLLEFTSTNDPLLANTFGPHKTSRRMTWHGPNRTGHQTDYIMMKKRFWSWINFARTRSFLGADVGSDHDLVVMTFRVHLQKVNKQKGTRMKFNLEKLKHPNIQKNLPSNDRWKVCSFNRPEGHRRGGTSGHTDENFFHSGH